MRPYLCTLVISSKKHPSTGAVVPSPLIGKRSVPSSRRSSVWLVQT
jgi:hypothetical protein